MAPGEPGGAGWIVCPKSNVNIANDRDWFKTLTPFKSQLADTREALGVGTVELEVKTHLSGKINIIPSTIVLKDVLFVPEYMCSILGRPACDEYHTVIGKDGPGSRYKIEGEYNEDTRVYERPDPGKLWLARYTEDKSKLHEVMLGRITTTWPKEEADRWSIFETSNTGAMLGHKAKNPKAAKQLDEVKKSDGMKNPGDGYTPAERAWLKRAFDGENQFLSWCKLSVWSPEAKAEGRAIARDLIKQEAEDGYTLAERAWLKRAFGSESQFLASHELNALEEADRAHGRLIARGLIDDEAKNGS